MQGIAHKHRLGVNPKRAVKFLESSSHRSNPHAPPFRNGPVTQADHQRAARADEAGDNGHHRGAFVRVELYTDGPANIADARRTPRPM